MLHTIRTLIALAVHACLVAIVPTRSVRVHSSRYLPKYPNLTAIYETYDENPGFHHWKEYAQHYQRHTQHLLHLQMAGQTVNMLEIGVQSGGSSRVWRQYFGKALRYVGVDINPACSQFQNITEGTHIEIGSQVDTTFLKRICDTYGPFHFIVDDGAHSTETIMTSLHVLWMCLHDSGVYAVEDLHAMTLVRGRSGMLVDGKDVFGHLSDAVRDMHEYQYFFRDSSGGYEPPNNDFTRHLDEVHFYDSLAFLHWRAQWKPLTEFRRGGAFIDYGRRKLTHADPVTSRKRTHAKPASQPDSSSWLSETAGDSGQGLVTMCVDHVLRPVHDALDAVLVQTDHQHLRRTHTDPLPMKLQRRCEDVMVSAAAPPGTSLRMAGLSVGADGMITDERAEPQAAAAATAAVGNSRSLRQLLAVPLQELEARIRALEAALVDRTRQQV